jgi:hypothetical protein
LGAVKLRVESGSIDGVVVKLGRTEPRAKVLSWRKAAVTEANIVREARISAGRPLKGVGEHCSVSKNFDQTRHTSVRLDLIKEFHRFGGMVVVPKDAEILRHVYSPSLAPA